MGLDDFVKTYSGQYVDVDLVYGSQCWDLVELYAEQVLQIPKEPWAITLGPTQSAKEAWTVFDAHMQRNFDKIPAGQEIKGDINVYDGHGVYPEGHINIDLGGQVFEQNADPDHSPAHISTRPRTYLLGSLRKKGSTMPYRDMSAQEVYEAYINYTNGHTIVKVTDPACQNRKENIPASDGGEFWRGLNNQQLNIIQSLDKEILDLQAQLAAGGTTATVLAPGHYEVK